MPQTMIRVLIADDHAAVRAATRRALHNDSRLRVVGEAEDGQSALVLVAEQEPDVLVLDLRLPKVRGLDVARAVTDRHPSVRVLILSGDDDDAYVSAAIGVGVSGYLVKTASASELIHAVRAVAAGQTVVPRRVPREYPSREVVRATSSTLERGRTLWSSGPYQVIAMS